MVSDQKRNIVEGFAQKRGVYYDEKSSLSHEPGSLYLKVRNAENRIYSDEQVKTLPRLKKHRYTEEWGMRALSSTRILKYFSAKPGGIVLDIGCGNGWFTNKLCSDGNFSVFGLDNNIDELEQAAVIFGDKNPKFVFGDVFSLNIPYSSVDYITIGAAIQYFEKLPVLLNRLFDILTQKGEIHIFDSPIYTSGEISGAQQRSIDYYANLGFPEMAKNYFHHAEDEFKGYSYEKLYLPAKAGIVNRIIRKKDIPFPWIRVKK